MPATSTLADILVKLAEEDGLGLYIAAGTGSTTTITETDTGVSELRGPFTGLKIPVGSPVTVITGGTVGEDSYVSRFTPSTGIITLSPAITTGATGFIIWNPEIEHGKYVEQAVSRALQNRMGRWEPRPLTFLPDGDLQGATVTDYWTAAANGTAAYAAAQVFPAGSAADAVGTVGLNRVVQLTTSGGSSLMDSNGIRVVQTNLSPAWYIRTAIRLVSGVGTATLSVRDNTNATGITVQITRGTDSLTWATTDLGNFLVCEGTFQLPATCAEISVRLALSATGLVAQMGPVIIFPLTVYSFPLPNRIESDDMIGNFYETVSVNNPTSLAGIFYCDPVGGGLEHRIYDYGDHRSVTFNFRPHRPIWFEEYVNGAAVSAMTDTTTFPSDRVHKWAKFEIYNWLMHREMQKRRAAENGVPLPSHYRPLRNAALKSAENSSYEPALKVIVGRR